MGKQVNIDQDKIEQTQIVINVKTLLWLLGGIIIGISTLYGMLKSDISGNEDSIKTEIQRIDGLRRDDYKILDEKITNILLRTNSRHEENSSGNAPMTTSTQAPPQ